MTILTLMSDPHRDDSIHHSIGFAVAAAPDAIVPDVQDPPRNSREIREALRDPAFAGAVRKELKSQLLTAFILFIVFLAVFIVVGLLLLG